MVVTPTHPRAARHPRPVRRRLPGPPHPPSLPRRLRTRPPPADRTHLRPADVLPHPRHLRQADARQDPPAPPCRPPPHHLQTNHRHHADHAVTTTNEPDKTLSTHRHLQRRHHLQFQRRSTPTPATGSVPGPVGLPVPAGGLW